MVVDTGVAIWVQVLPFQFSAVATVAPVVALLPTPAAQASVGENAWTCTMSS